MKAKLVTTIVVAILALLPSSLNAASKSTKFQIEETTIDDIQSAILKHQITATDVVKMYLARIKAYDGPCVKMPEGLLGSFTTIPHAGQINSLITVNLRPANRIALGLDAHKGRSMTDLVDDNPDMPDALEVAAKEDAYFNFSCMLVGPLRSTVFALTEWFRTVDVSA